MKFISKLDAMFVRVEHVILVTLLASMLGVGFFQVILRNFFNSGIEWADVLIRHLVLWVGLIGASMATQSRKHLNMDALSRVISPKANTYISLLINIVAFLVTMGFAFGAVLFIRAELGYSIQETIDLTSELETGGSINSSESLDMDSELDALLEDEGLDLDLALDEEVDLNNEDLALEDDPLLDESGELQLDFDDLSLDSEPESIESGGEEIEESSLIPETEGRQILPGIPVWFAQIIIPFAFIIISLRFLIKALEDISAIIKKDYKTPEINH